MVKVDTGMSRNGCQPEELDSIMDVSSVTVPRFFTIPKLIFFLFLHENICCVYSLKARLLSREPLELKVQGSIPGVRKRISVSKHDFHYAICRMT